MLRTPASVVLAVALAAALAGCQGPGSSDDGGGGSSPGEYERDPWLLDDLENDAYLADGTYEGMTMVGFGCAEPEYFTADSLGDAFTPSASAGFSPDRSTISWINADGISTGFGPGIAAPAVPGSVTISTTEGIYDIGDGGTNTPGWTTSMTLELRSIPIPDEDGCSAMWAWYDEQRELGTPVEEMFAGFTEVGPDLADDACRDQYGYTWLPTGWDCERYAVYNGDSEGSE